MSNDLSLSLGAFKAVADEAVYRIEQDNIIKRIWAHDHTVWKDSPDEITNRLGWLYCPENMAGCIDELDDFVEGLCSDGIQHVLLLGMGGSSMAPELFARVFGSKEGYPELRVLDSTDPGALLQYAQELNPKVTVYIVATKSGGTVETFSFMKYFYNQALRALGEQDAGKHFVAITDPESGLEVIARDLGFRKIFLNDPEIGGRYAVLSYFGLVAAAVIGMDVKLLLDRAAGMAREARKPGVENSAAVLGAVMGSLALRGRDKLTFVMSPAVTPFGPWVEQLIAESTGKDGTGILPVEGESLEAPKAYADDRLFVHLRVRDDNIHDSRIEALRQAGHPVVRIDLEDPYDLGSEFLRWQMATAVAGTVLGINPFDQPNVESAKVMARQMVRAYKDGQGLPELTPAASAGGITAYADFKVSSPEEALGIFLEKFARGTDDARGRGYISIQAYLKPSALVNAAFHDLRCVMQKKYRAATTVGYGPRFLHSTGQLHKGDAGHGLFIQFTASMPEDADIPDEPGAEASGISFGVLRSAQALGDRSALLSNGRNVIRFDLGDDVRSGIRRLMKSLF